MKVPGAKEQHEAERRKAWIARTTAALSPHGEHDLHGAIVNLARCMEASHVMTLDVRLRPFVSTSFVGCVVVTTADPDLKDVQGFATVGAGRRMEDRPVEEAGGLKLVAVHGADMGNCAKIAMKALVAELGTRA